LNLDFATLVAAFCGGIWGAAVGAVPAFIFTGLLAMFGALSMTGGEGAVLQVAFGPIFGPHVSFGGGVAAAAYAGRHGVLPTGRDVGAALAGARRADVLLVGGAFGVLGLVIDRALLATGVGNWTDTIALTVVVTAIVARLVFGRTPLLGAAAGPDGRRFRPDETAHWLPWQQQFSHVVLIGAGIGAIGAYLVHGTSLGANAPPLAFGIATVTLVFLVTGRQVPVSHHIALPAALGVLHGTGFVGGIACGIAGAVIGELASRLLLIRGDTHIDPPAVGIAAVVFLLKVGTALGLLRGLA
jgi:hypothetical protein